MVLDAGTIFATVSTVMLANGLVLAIVSRDLPPMLAPASKEWQFGTILIAIGCALFALGSELPRSLMLTLANGFMVFGLTSYHMALQRFDGHQPRAWQFLPAIMAVACVFWFSAITPNFWIRVLLVSLVWGWLMLASVVVLLRPGRSNPSVSRTFLAALFGSVLLYHVVRVGIYLHANLGSNFIVESDGHWLNLVSPIFMTLLPIVGTTLFLLMCNDHLRQQLEKTAATDYLTGLPNRRTLARHGEACFAAAENRSVGFSVAVFDIDNFKAINDTYGHEMGDRVLVDVASHLRDQAGEAIVVARSGGEEFAVLLKDSEHSSAATSVERMRSAVENAHFCIGSIRVPITVSAGVAVYRKGDRAFEDMFSRADQALYRAKACGRNRVEVARIARVI